MAVTIAYDGRPPLDGDRLHAPVEQRAAAYGSLIAHAGHYTL